VLVISSRDIDFNVLIDWRIFKNNSEKRERMNE
jgi:hypothetical protein